MNIYCSLSFVLCYLVWHLDAQSLKLTFYTGFVSMYMYVHCIHVLDRTFCCIFQIGDELTRTSLYKRMKDILTQIPQKRSLGNGKKMADSDREERSFKYFKKRMSKVCIKRQIYTYYNWRNVCDMVYFIKVKTELEPIYQIMKNYFSNKNIGICLFHLLNEVSMPITRILSNVSPVRGCPIRTIFFYENLVKSLSWH